MHEDTVSIGINKGEKGSPHIVDKTNCVIQYVRYIPSKLQCVGWSFILPFFSCVFSVVVVVGIIIVVVVDVILIIVQIEFMILGSHVSNFIG